MKEVAIYTNYELEQHRHKLHFDGLPLVVALIRYDSKSQEQNLPASQMSAIRRMLGQEFGQYGFNVIWVIEEAPGHLSLYRAGAKPGEYRECLTLVAELLRAGYGQYLAVSRLDRLTRNLLVYVDLAETVLMPSGVKLLVASGLSGPAPSLHQAIAMAGGSHE